MNPIECEMRVLVTVEIPDGIEPTDELVKQLAMGAVCEHEVSDCGPPGHIVWAGVYAEVDDTMVEITDEK